MDEVHDLHVWEVTSGFPALSAHVLVGPDCDAQKHREEPSAELLRDRFGTSSIRPSRSSHATRAR